MSTDALAINPCWHMRTLVHRLAEGTLAGMLLRYTRFHVGSCERCRKAVEILKATLSRLRLLRAPQPSLDEKRWSVIESAWNEEEQTRGP